MEFDFPAHCAICGRSKSGKTTVSTDIIKTNAHKFKRIIVFSNTNKILKEYDFIKKIKGVKYISDKWNLKKFLYICNHNRKKDAKPTLIILDDVSSAFTLATKPEKDALAGAMTECRHFNISVFVSLHYPKGLITPLFREQFQYWILRKLSKKALEAFEEILYYDPDDYGGRDFKEFIKTELDEEYKWMICCVEKDKYFTYKVLDVNKNLN